MLTAWRVACSTSEATPLKHVFEFFLAEIVRICFSTRNESPWTRKCVYGPNDYDEWSGCLWLFGDGALTSLFHHGTNRYCTPTVNDGRYFRCVSPGLSFLPAYSQVGSLLHFPVWFFLHVLLSRSCCSWVSIAALSGFPIIST
jgi:hypothetical protein